MRKAGKDVLLVTKWNKKAVADLKRADYVRSLGVADKGRSKGKEGVLITPSAERYLDELRKERKEAWRYWFMVFITIFAGTLGFILGKMFG